MTFSARTAPPAQDANMLRLLVAILASSIFSLSTLGASQYWFFVASVVVDQGGLVSGAARADVAGVWLSIYGAWAMVISTFLAAATQSKISAAVSSMLFLAYIASMGLWSGALQVVLALPNGEPVSAIAWAIGSWGALSFFPAVMAAVFVSGIHELPNDEVARA
jgi:hypothetical protein